MQVKPTAVHRRTPVADIEPLFLREAPRIFGRQPW
jgi:hypothetical protein